jgi:molybdopterin molybdotransferase
MISVGEALGRLFALAGPPDPEEVPLVEAAGRVLLRPLAALRDQPPFAASAMDGYAVRAADAVAGARLRVVGEAAAGRGFHGLAGPGEAVRILTGAPLPPGTDAVVMQEYAPRDGEHITVGPEARPGHVRAGGSDFRAGATLAAPRRLSPADVALLAAFGRPEATVARRPAVALISTGDELVMPGEAAGPDAIFAANAFGLHAQLAREGAAPRLLPIADDSEAGLRGAFDLAEGCDLVVTIGGASVGDHDLVAPVARSLGAELSFHRIAMRPGKPILAGRLPGGAVLLGLPGNPVSAMVCGTVFMLPLVRAMLGLPAEPAPRRSASLAAALPPNGPREHYLRARTRPDGAVEPFSHQDSSLLSVLAESDCLVVQPPGDAGRGAGEPVDVIHF